VHNEIGLGAHIGMISRPVTFGDLSAGCGKLFEAESFTRIYDAHYPRVFRYLLGRTRKPPDAEDLTAEVFAVALESLKRGAAPRKVGSWLVGIADHLASRFFRQQLSDPPRIEGDCAATQDPEEIALGRLEGRVLWQCFDGLSAEHQQALLLRFVAGLSAREVGAIMGRTEEAVRGVQFRALNALRQAWTEAEHYGGLPRTARP
jgi:RNA polymerase sigma-70 factor, ECF subfamily